MKVESWGRFPRVSSESFHVTDIAAPLPVLKGPILPHGLGRSYGDVCLVDAGTHVLTRRCSRILQFDERGGTISCESGASLAEVIARTVPRGWFPPVVPGTQHVTIGGAIANDIHGKNHHGVGTFGSHVQRFGLRRTSGELLQCSPTENAELFKATIGGLGLTGLITCADFKLARVKSNAVVREAAPFGSLREFIELSGQFRARPYIVGWIDCLAGGRPGRGVLFTGEDAPQESTAQAPRRYPAVPASAPSWLLNGLSARALNTMYGFLHRRPRNDIVHFESFFFPLDSLPAWNLLYGKAGFLQWQCVVPGDVAIDAVEAMIAQVRRSKDGAYLGVIKLFGDRQSPGMLSFPRAGITLALDFPIRGQRTFDLLDVLDTILMDAGGSLYAAKDARMSAAMFRQSHPRLDEFLPHRDAGISSALWMRVMDGAS